MVIFTVQISVLIKGGMSRGWEGEGRAGLFDNVINESVSLETAVVMIATG